MEEEVGEEGEGILGVDERRGMLGVIEEKGVLRVEGRKGRRGGRVDGGVEVVGGFRV